MPDFAPTDPSRVPMRFGADGRFELQPAQYRLLIDGEPAALGGRALDLLFVLASRPTELFSKEELLARVWPGLIVEENNLRVQVNSLRKALGDDLIVTVPGRGYRLAAVPEAVGAPDPPAANGTRTDPGERDSGEATGLRADLARAPVLPAELDAFIGRGDELAALRARLDAGDRLVTVIGPGGAGKTRFVCRFAGARWRDWPGGVYFCDLSEARTVGGIASSMARALNVSFGADDPVSQIGHVIAGRGRCLIVLDNFEQVAAHAAATLGSWMASAGQASFVVTSLKVLALKGEHVMALAPLQPDRGGVELFAVRARARRNDFVLTPASREDVAQIVTMLDGLPLAIELAAARVRVFSPAQLLARLKDRFGLLVDPHSRQPRQATLRASIDWSWSLLEAWERAALAQISVFAGAFTMDAAEAVIDLSAWPAAPPVVDVIQSLLDRSLLRSLSPFAGKSPDLDVPYFGLLISIREYAAEKLCGDDLGDGAADAARRRHGRYYARSGAEEVLDGVDRHGGPAKLLALGVDLENLVAACQHALHCGDTAVATATHAATWRVLQSRGPFQLGIDMGQQILALPDLSAHDRAHATRRLANALRLTGRPDEAAHHLQDAMALYRAVGDRRGQGEVLLGLGDLQNHFHGRLRDAQKDFDAALEIFVEIGDRRLEGIARGNLGTVLESLGRAEDARQRRWQAVAIHREVGHRRMEAHELGNLANASIDEGRLDEGLALSDEALAIARECADRRIEGHVLGNRGLMYLEQGRLADARRDFEDALTIARESANRRFESNVRRNLGDLLASEGQLQEAVKQYESALTLARDVGNRMGEARIFGHLGQVLAKQGRIERAREAFAAGASLLQCVEDPVTLGLLLCQQGQCEVAAGDAASARRLLERALGLLEQAGAIPGSVLEAATSALRKAIAPIQATKS